MPPAKIAALLAIFFVTACTTTSSSFTDASLLYTSEPNSRQAFSTQIQPTELMARFSTPKPHLTPKKLISASPIAQHTMTPFIEPTKTSIPSQTSTPSITPTETMLFTVCSPLEFVAIKDLYRVVSSPYNPPPMGSDDRHQGADFTYYHWKNYGMAEGTAIKSVFQGRVAAALENTFPFGTLAIIETDRNLLPKEWMIKLDIPEDKSLYLLYAHMQAGSLKVETGQIIYACQPIGAMGRTGNTDAPHLHLESRIGPPDTSFYGFAAFTTVTPEERANYVRWRISGEFLHFDPMKIFKDVVP